MPAQGVSEMRVAGTAKGPQLSGAVASAQASDKGAWQKIEAFWTGERIAGSVVTTEGKRSFSGRCEPDVDSLGGALGVFSGKLPDREAWPEKYIDPSVFKKTADPLRDPSAFYCSLRGTRIEGLGTLALMSAITRNCPQDFAVAGGGSGACSVGPPESNPPTPPNVAGALVNVISRSLQEWPHITQSEASVAVKRAAGGDSGTIMVGFNDTTALFVVRPEQAGGVGFAWSVDAGASYRQNPEQLALRPSKRPSQYVAGSFSATDPSLDFALNPQRFEAAAMDLTIYVLPPGIPIFAPGLMVAKSGLQNSDYTFPGIGINGAGVFDKPWYAVRKFLPRPDVDTGFVCATQIFSQPTRYGIVLFEVPMNWVANPSVSQDLAPLSVTFVSDLVADPDIVQGCQVAQAPDGALWVSWWEEAAGVSRIKARRYDVSRDVLGPVVDASGPFTAPRDEAASADCGRSALKGHIRYAPFPSMALDPVDGRIYIAYSAADSGSPAFSRVFVARSTDAGATWARWRVDDPGPGDRFMPALAVSDARVVRVMWYDRRNDPNNLNIDVYFDTGVGWSTDQRLTSAPFGIPRLLPNFDCATENLPLRVADCYMGDYNGVSAGPFDSSSAFEFVHAWGDNSLKFYDPDTGQNVPDPDVRAARVSGCQLQSSGSGGVGLLPVLTGLVFFLGGRWTRRKARIRRTSALRAPTARSANTLPPGR